MSNKKVKIIEKIGNITYLAPVVEKKKRKMSAEKKRQLSEKRRKRKVQPRQGQSKKCQNFYSQLFKDYIKQTSAMGKFMRGKSANMHSKDNYDPTDLTNNDNVFDLEEYMSEVIDEEQIEEETAFNNGKHIGYEKKFIKPIKITHNHKKEISKWLKKYEKQLKSLNGDNGIFNEYDVQKLLFNEFKMTENIMQNIEENSKNHLQYDDLYINILDNEMFNIFNNKDISFDNKLNYMFALFDKRLYELLYSEDKDDEFDGIKKKYLKTYYNSFLFYTKSNINPKLTENFVDIIIYSILLHHKNKRRFDLIKNYIKEHNKELIDIMTVDKLKEIIDVV